MEENTQLEIGPPMKTQEVAEEKILSKNLFGAGAESETKATIDGWWVAECNGMTHLVCTKTESEAVDMFRSANRLVDTESVSVVPADRLPQSGTDAIYLRTFDPVKVGDAIVVPVPIVMRCTVDRIPDWIEARSKLFDTWVTEPN